MRYPNNLSYKFESVILLSMINYKEKYKLLYNPGFTFLALSSKYYYFESL
jgi:hypothetical protein